MRDSRNLLFFQYSEDEGTYVDVGCGNGQATLCFAPFFKNVQGLDISKAMIEAAREKASSEATGTQYAHVQFG